MSLYRGDGRLIRSAVYGIGAGLSFTPREVDEMTVWELAACIDGYNAAQGGEAQPEPPTPDEFDAMITRDRAIVLGEPG